LTSRSKTKEKILATSLALFNHEGEAQVSAVDVASVIGISPGNLYYHYKGKDEIIAALFEDFDAEIRQVSSIAIKVSCCAAFRHYAVLSHEFWHSKNAPYIQ